VIHDIALQNLSVKILIDRAGLVGEDGATHHGVFDICLSKGNAKFVIMAPKDGYELEEMIKLSHSLDSPVAIRYPRGKINEYKELPKNDITFGRAEVLFSGGNIAIISVGHIFSVAYDLYKLIEKLEGPQTLINIRFIKPLDIETIHESVYNKDIIVILEEGAEKGGIGEEIALLLYEKGIKGKTFRFAIPDRFIEHGTIDELRNLIGLNNKYIFKKIMEYEKLRLDTLILKRGLTESRSKAQALIMMGSVYVNGQKIDKCGTFVDEKSDIYIKEKLPYVSRGGLKLEKARDYFHINFKDKVVLDIGSSTGGFTDLALQSGAKRVHAVDVGKNLLHYSLINCDKIVKHFGINFRYIDYNHINERVDIIVCDVSFISIKKLLGNMLQFCQKGTEFVLLIKPQFEAMRKDICKNGIVKDLKYIRQ